MPVGVPATAAFSVLVRKKNFVDDMYDTISVQDITVSHSGIVHLKNTLEVVEGVREQIVIQNV
jgi:hypothetical protein